MTRQANLILHVDSTAKSLADLEAMPDPEVMGSRHVPVHPAKFVKSLLRAVEEYGFNVLRNKIGATDDGSRLFGVMDLAHPNMGHYEDRVLSLGYRNSTNQTLSRGLVGGDHVTVCDNLVLSGDMILLRSKNTNDQLMPAFEEGLDKFDVARKVLERTIERAKGIALSRTFAESLLWQVFRKGLLPKKLMAPVEDVWLTRPEASGVQGDTLWDLHNSMTYILKNEDTVSRWNKTMAVGKFLGEVTEELK